MNKPDQIFEPDWSDVRSYAESLLEQQVEMAIDEENSNGISYEYLIAQAVLEALYGPNHDDLVQELVDQRNLGDEQD